MNLNQLKSMQPIASKAKETNEEHNIPIIGELMPTNMKLQLCNFSKNIHLIWIIVTYKFQVKEVIFMTVNIS